MKLNVEQIHTRNSHLLRILFPQGASSASELELYCGCDQVGSLKMLSTANGTVLKHICFDSFGNIKSDNLPLLHLPVGFAGGLHDEHSKLTRFGYRDYDPYIGRFLTPDPLGDTGGDHDLYDYCIDDPISATDKNGLLPILIPLIIGGKLLAGAIAAGGLYASAKTANKIKSKTTGVETTAALDAVDKVKGKTAAIVAGSAVGGLAPWAVVQGGTAAAAAGSTAARFAASKIAKPAIDFAADKMYKGTTKVLEAATTHPTAAKNVKRGYDLFKGAVDPQGLAPATGAELLGVVAKQVYDDPYNNSIARANRYMKNTYEQNHPKITEHFTKDSNNIGDAFISGLGGLNGSS